MTTTKKVIQDVLCRIFPGARATRPLTMAERGQLNDVVTAVLAAISDGVFPLLDDLVVLGWFKELREMGVLSTATRERLTRCETHMRAEAKAKVPQLSELLTKLESELTTKLEELTVRDSERGQLNAVVTAVLISISDGIFPSFDSLIALGWFKDLHEMGVLNAATQQRLTRLLDNAPASASINPLSTVNDLMRKIDELQHKFDDAEEKLDAANEKIERMTKEAEADLDGLSDNL